MGKMPAFPGSPSIPNPFEQCSFLDPKKKRSCFSRWQGYNPNFEGKLDIDQKFLVEVYRENG